MGRWFVRLGSALLVPALVCLSVPAPTSMSHAAEQKKEEKGDSKKNFEETKRELKKGSENVEKAITEGASTAAQKVKKAFERDQKK